MNGKQAETVQGSVQTEGKSGNQPGEHILICLSSAPSNAKIIRTAARMAQAYQGTLTALFVETPKFASAGNEDRARLQANTRLAQELGAVTEHVVGDDISFQIAEFARLNGVTKIVIGRSNAAGRRFPGQRMLTDKLIACAPNIEIYIIPDASYRVRRERPDKPVFTLRDTIKSILSLTAATGLSLLFYELGLTDANIITVYILGVLITSVVTRNMIYGVLDSVASVFVFNYLFTDPRYTLFAYDIGYPMTFLIMLLASLLTGTLAARMKNLAYQSARNAYRTKLLLDTNQSLQHAQGREAIVHAAADQLSKLTGRNVSVYLPESCDLEKLLEEKDTDGKMYYPIRLGGVLYGVAGIDVKDDPVDAFENGILMSILGECALAMENEKNAREKEAAAVLAQNEQLRANLLRTISHDLRTPLTSISGNASNLMTNGAEFDEATKQQLYTDIYDDSMWLINLVENLLSVTRMEGQGVKLHQTTELMDEVIAEALRHIDRRKSEHMITVQNENELLLVQMDAKLIVQVIINLVNNAIKYTQKGSAIKISVQEEKHMAVVSVADDGPGIPDEMKPHIFELFYTGEHPVRDDRRSMGLGLALCRSIIDTHGGKIHVSDAEPHGSVFTFTLPIREVKLHE